jgi:hypothetical protein
LDDRGRGLAAGTGPWLGHVLVVGLGLSVLALITGNLGDLSRALNGVLAVAGLLALALLWPRRPERLPLWRMALSLAIMAASLPVVARGGPLGTLGAALFFFALSLLPLKANGPATALLLTSLLFALHQILVAYVPILWHAEQWLAIQFSWFVGVGLMLNPTALGLPLFVLFALYALSAFLLSLASPASIAEEAPPASSTRERRRSSLIFIVWLLGLVLAMGAYVWLQPSLGSWLLTNWPAPITASPTLTPPSTLTYLESQLLLFALLGLVSALPGLGLRTRALPLSPPVRSKRWTGGGLAFLAFATLVLTLDPPFHPQRGTVLFYGAGHLDWDRPVFGRYGPQSGGDFGLWPDYLAAYGYETQIGLLTPENLKGAQAVVLINVPHMFSAEEKDRLLAFVQEGGALIVWGEHTGVGRIREPINDLLATVPIRLKFDSAVPSRQGWAEGLSLLPYPAVYDVQDPVDLVIAVGASLQIAPPARPVIVGRFGHSDRGDVTNRALNYVGDMRYNSGERLGDVVLAAEVDYGQGRIVVLGDTTPAGSVNLMTTMPFQIRLLDWATAHQSKGLASIWRNNWLAALLLLAAGVCLVLGRSRTTVAGAALVLGLSLLLATRVNTARSAPPVPTGPIAYVDVSHQERFDRLLWEETSIGGLAYNLVRNGCLPLLLRKVEEETLANAEALVVIAPGSRFSPKEIETISRWVEEGGRLLVSVGWEESEASQTLLAAFGLEVGHTPLGPVEVERDTGLVRFHEAWPVGAEHEDALAIVSGYDYPLAIYQPWGNGGVALIGDSAFLLGSTLESSDGYQEGNILLLRDILQDYLRLGDHS